MSDWEVQASDQERDIRTRLQLLDPPDYVCRVSITYRDDDIPLYVGQSLEYLSLIHISEPTRLALI
eukprot:4452896-Alexandrium_andersonii.AAC.1